MQRIAQHWRNAASPSESAPECVEDGEDSSDNAISQEALAKERVVRAVMAHCITQELSAETMRLNLMGLCRSLNLLSQLAVERSDNKDLCMEAAGLVAVTTSCEQMLRSVSAFELVRQYRFHQGHVSPGLDL